MVAVRRSKLAATTAVLGLVLAVSLPGVLCLFVALDSAPGCCAPAQGAVAAAGDCCKGQAAPSTAVATALTAQGVSGATAAIAAAVFGEASARTLAAVVRPSPALILRI